MTFITLQLDADGPNQRRGVHWNISPLSWPTNDSHLTTSRPSMPKMLDTADDDPDSGVERMDTQNE